MFDPQQVMRGQKLKNELKETPTSFRTDSGAASPTGNKTRMAGDFIAELQDPDTANKVSGWIANFAMSPQGMQFNQAKMMGMGGMG